LGFLKGNQILRLPYQPQESPSIVRSHGQRRDQIVKWGGGVVCMHRQQLLIGRHPRKPHRTSDAQHQQHDAPTPSLFLLATQLHTSLCLDVALEQQQSPRGHWQITRAALLPLVESPVELYATKRHTKSTASCRRQISSCLHLPTSCPLHQLHAPVSPLACRDGQNG
jgi:hypothetical protein